MAETEFDPAGYEAQLIARGIDRDAAAKTVALMVAARERRANGADVDELIGDGFEPEQAVKLAALRKGRAAAGQVLAVVPRALHSAKVVALAPAPPGATTPRPATPLQLPPTIEPKAKEGPLTRRQQQQVDAAAAIAGEPPSGDDMAFTHAVLCQVGLPRSKVEGTTFLRQSGSAWVNMQAGVLDEGNGPVQQPLPYGVMPRLALAWVSTYAKRFNTREIPIGNSAAEFLRMMNMDSGGRRYTTLRMQMHALAACRLQLGYKGRTFNGQAVEQFDAWVADKDGHQRALWPGVMLLSEGYHKELMDNGVPLDNRALDDLKGSALALDAYTWLAHRLHRIEGRPVTLHWKALREQFAQEYKGKDADKDFKKVFIPALHSALNVYPKAKVKQVAGGLLLMASPPPVAYKAA